MAPQADSQFLIEGDPTTDSQWVAEGIVGEAWSRFIAPIQHATNSAKFGKFVTLTLTLIKFVNLTLS